MKRVVEIGKFDLTGFTERVLDYCRRILNPEIDPTAGIVFAKDYSSVPESGEEGEKRNLQNEILEDDLMLFFPFIMGGGEDSVVSADGKSWSFDPDDEDSEFSILSDPMTIYGLTLRKADESFIIESATHYLGACTFPPPFIDHIEDCGFLEKPMSDFVDLFVNQ